MKKALSTLLIICSLTTSPHVLAKDITTADIVESGLNKDCINYCIVGICYFLFCTPVGCKINTSARISHYLPDLVVSVYDEPDENPWTEYREMMGNAEVATQEGILSSISGSDVSGGNLMPANENVNNQLRFKEASVVGNPFITIAQEEYSGSYLCPSDATPYRPYFSSAFDYLGWRWGIPDRFNSAALIPGEREVGSRTTSNLLGNTWGAVYPRSGLILQQDDAKAAAVIAQRAVDIVTRDGQPHVYRPLSDDSEDGQIQAQNSAKKSQGGSNEKRDHWQMISPKKDETCTAFGNNDADWSKDRNPEGERQYVWNYWRSYECCIPKPGIYIGHTSTPPVCF